MGLLAIGFIFLVQFFVAAVSGARDGSETRSVRLKTLFGVPLLLLGFNGAVISVDHYMFGPRGYFYSWPYWGAYVVGTFACAVIVVYAGSIFGGLIKMFLPPDE
jgi:hypothetical protein